MNHVRAARIQIVLGIWLCAFADPSEADADALRRLPYNNSDLVVDLGVGLWAQPLPMDFDGDGDLDMVVATADVPYNGIYYFENPDGNVADPVFRPAVRIGDAVHNISISHGPSGWTVTTPGNRHPQFRSKGLTLAESIEFDPTFAFERIRANQWRFVDYDGDGLEDLVIGLGVWDDYGWDDAYDEKGTWTNGPLHGHVYIVRNEGTNQAPQYGEMHRLLAGGAPIDVYGSPSPTFADFDGDGDLDLVCGEFLDGFTYFENIGNRRVPLYAPGRRLEYDKKPVRMDLQMLQVTSIDWDGDGDADLIVGQEDGRVAFVENSGRVEQGLPQFRPPRFFRQQAADVKVGALCTPVSVDWDGDEDMDLIVGDTAGYIHFVENLGGGADPRWAIPTALKAKGETIRIQAGENGSIQGPCEARWGYTAPSVADWDHDGDFDIVINSIWGEILWFRNDGTSRAPRLAAAEVIGVQWPGPAPKPEWVWWTPEGNQLVTQWRTTPFVIDLNRDGLNDLVMLDRDGYLAFFERARSEAGLTLLPGERVFRNEDGSALRLNDKRAGKSGRRKFTMVDWDGDQDLDILINSRSIDLLRNVADKPGEFVFRNEGPLTDHRLAGHTTSPTTVDWNRDGIPDLLVGAEDGFLYFLDRSATSYRD